jgi:hypothetical protein
MVTVPVLSRAAAEVWRYGIWYGLKPSEPYRYSRQTACTAYTVLVKSFHHENTNNSYQSLIIDTTTLNSWLGAWSNIVQPLVGSFLAVLHRMWDSIWIFLPSTVSIHGTNVATVESYIVDHLSILRSVSNIQISNLFGLTTNSFSDTMRNLKIFPLCVPVLVVQDSNSWA